MMKHPDFQTPEINETYDGRSYLCSCEAHELFAPLPGSGSRVCEEVARKNNEMDRFRVFRYPDLDRNSTPTESVLKQRSVEERITSLLLSLKTPTAVGSYMLVQFWVPSGDMLMLSEQPFGIRGLYNGFYRYRYSCIQAEEDGYSASEDGPLVRVFARGYPEYCKGIDSYSIEEFPMKDLAKLCGFSDYLALPIFDRGQQCLGVLEFLSCGTDLHSVMNSFEDSEFEYAFPHSRECSQVHPYIPISRINVTMLTSVREEHRSPLIQIWVPCICDTTSRFTQLVCQKRSFNLPMDCASEDLHMSLSNGSHSVSEGKGWVGRAYSEQKTCFCRYTSQISISDYPLLLLTRSSGLTKCLAIPLHFIHPKLTSLVLEVFLPPEQSCDADIEDVLKSLLPTLARELSKINVAFGLREDEEFCVKHSHSDDENFVYFDVYRSGGTRKKAVGNISEQPHFPSSHQEVEVAAGNRDGGRDRTEEMLKKKFLSPSQVPKPLKANDMSSLHDLAETLRTALDAINQYRGCRKVFSSEEKRVTRGSWKCRCRKFGIGLLSRKKKKVIRCASNSTPTSEEDKSMALHGRDETEQSYSVTVKANCRENYTAKFQLCSNSGIQQLHAELHKRFILEVDKYNVKYEDEDGDWIILCCDEDLHLCMEAQKRSSKSAIRMLVIPVSYKVIR